MINRNWIALLAIATVVATVLPSCTSSTPQPAATATVTETQEVEVEVTATAAPPEEEPVTLHWNLGGEPMHIDPQLHEPDQQNIPELWADFVKCIRTGETPVCDIEIGHRSTNMSLLGMLSLKLGRSVRWDGEKEVVLDDPEANRLLRREYRHPWKYPEIS